MSYAIIIAIVIKGKRQTRKWKKREWYRKSEDAEK